MSKRYSVICSKILIMMLATYAVASHANPCCNIQSKVYVGIQAGVISIVDLPTIMQPMAGNVVHQDEGDFGSSIGAIAGYGLKINRLYLGAEAFYEKTSPRFVTDVMVGSSSHFNTAIQDRVGISLIPGIYLRETTKVFTRVGYLRSRIRQRSANDFREKPSGGEIGLGLEESINCHFSLRGEYIYSKYRSFSKDRVEEIDESDVFRMSSHQFLFSLIYNFI